VHCADPQRRCLACPRRTVLLAAAPAAPQPLEAVTDAQLTAVARQVWKVIPPMPGHLREFVRLLSIEVSR
jgi:hypothetical protein